MRIRLRITVLLSIAAVACIGFFWFNGRIPTEQNLEYGLEEDGSLVPPTSREAKMACVRPELDINDPTIAKFFQPSSPIKCDPDGDWVCIDKGKAFVCKEAMQRFGKIDCVYTFLERNSDVSTVNGEVVKGGNEPVLLKSDFFKVSCKNDKNVTWNNIMAGIRSNPQVHSRASWSKLPPNGPEVNVLMWGFDSLSRNTFMRKLPKTYSYITNELGAIVLKGYNIVGDGTPQALIPILTGQTEPELPETRKRMFGAQHVNVYPFVWKDYSENGYVTAYGEDCPNIGTFTYRLKGFGTQPTDHYARAFYVAADNQLKYHRHLCLGGTPRHKVMMNWVRQFFSVYADKPKFSFTFHSELSHSDYNLVGSADSDLLEMIEALKSDGHLNNTVLILMSDHGHRFAAIREHQQGKQEERLPFFSFTFPHWFENKYPRAMSNFRKNAERLTTPFDIFPTLRAILRGVEDSSWRSELKKRSISLFSEVPLSRTCEAADIEPHWCTCLNWKTISSHSENAMKAAEVVLEFLNQLMAPHKDLCAVLSLKELIWAGMYTPNQGLLKFKKNADLDGFKADLSGSGTANMELYQVKIRTQPGGGHFEASLKYDVAQNKYTIKETDISRTNVYGHAADCIEKKAEQLRKFCYCKKTQPNG